MLAGAETSAARSSSTSAALSELTHAYSRLLRRGQPLRELGLSSGERASHRSWASGISLSSCGRMLAGAGRGCGGCPPTNEGSSDVATSSARLLRRRQTLKELVLSSGERVSRRSYGSGNLLSSCERMLAGAGGGCGGCPPSSEGSSAVAISFARLLRQKKLVTEKAASIILPKIRRIADAA